jgi:hypothetical protein
MSIDTSFVSCLVVPITIMQCTWQRFRSQSLQGLQVTHCAPRCLDPFRRLSIVEGCKFHSVTKLLGSIQKALCHQGL